MNDFEFEFEFDFALCLEQGHTRILHEHSPLPLAGERVFGQGVNKPTNRTGRFK